MLTLVVLALALIFLPAPWSYVVVIVAAVIDLVETGAFLWWSKRRRVAVGVETLVGRRAVAVGVVGPAGGQVKIDGELWEARSGVDVDPGAEVQIRSVDGLVLHVAEPGPAAPEKH